MTKKHFIALANYIRDHRDQFDDVHIWHLANFCKSQNQKFKWFRWTAYIRGECGPNGGRIRRRIRPRPRTVDLTVNFDQLPSYYRQVLTEGEYEEEAFT